MTIVLLTRLLTEVLIRKEMAVEKKMLENTSQGHLIFSNSRFSRPGEEIPPYFLSYVFS